MPGKQMKRTVKTIIICVCLLIIILIPLPADDLYLRFHVREGSTDGYRIYYATQSNPDYSDEQYVDSVYDEETGQIRFVLDASLEGSITGIRLDYPAGEDMIVIDGISVNSGGIVKKRISVPSLFNEGNYLMIHGITIDTVSDREMVYAAVTPDDPFVVFGSEGVSLLSTGFSHKLSTKICIALLIAIALILYNKDLFGKESSEEQTA
ncbi:MAG: hypothetical protein J6W85_09825 [Lachnospiraceae bacterium]|nr:hypothetical protein [Lachnospiraceae bacterium]MBP5761694.1 hypothetical protein [Lachnospiraceae bacterium]